MRPSLLDPLFASVVSLKGVGPRLGERIAKAAGPRVIDLALLAPVSVIDRTYRPTVADARIGEIATLEVRVDRLLPPPVKRLPFRAVCSDETGVVTLNFFNARADYLARALPEGATRLVSGRIEAFDGGLRMTHPDYIVDPSDPDELPLIEPVYPLTAGISAGVMRKAARHALARTPALPEWQEPVWLERQRWPSFNEALAMMHRPQGRDDLSADAPARRRLAYDELLANQLALVLIRRDRRRQRTEPMTPTHGLRAKALAALPFKLTGAQSRVIGEIDADMASGERMVRLVQGDVGSGKTLVAFAAMLNAIECGAQAALMAPTEILARQHAKSLTPLCDAAGVTMVLLTGRDKSQERAAKLEAIRRGFVHVVLGTHALFQDAVDFQKLGLVVVDEQHRFGVHQRLALSGKGARPHMLVMTATPIPRTLALTAYGDMDVSVLDEKPPGRKPIATRALPLDRLDEVVDALSRAFSKGEQVYWVCPLVEESETLALTAAEDRHMQLKAVFGDRVGLVHGRQSPAEKDAIMAAFHAGAVLLLIATTVIEVGVDAPNATVIVIENAERFGLAQLHQLRGRVGRGEKPGACLLLYKAPLGPTAKARLSILRDTEDGFRIAEEDLRLRGAGDLLGSAQSGFPKFRLADIGAHGDLLKAACDDAQLLVDRDPELRSARGEAARILLYMFSRDDAVRLLRAG